ncbi:universal stress protein [Natrarchaeobius oligotrophus]|uniref:Universal stress protein n=1 Tax=Natrarchaeobius chitinivorans TaxID=1679083 RepID=A0A3N6MEV1_NATCH|nr:universal stress protein [Natrarchaeobius chitinivorans]RQH02534.1 universal stress protein [Natrarchaeobius chitinivorans]
MHRILAPVDLDEKRALSQVRWIASLPDAERSVRVILVFVFERDELDDLPAAVKSGGSSRDVVTSVAVAYQYLEERDVDVTLVDRRFNPVEKIRQEVLKRDVQTIVLGGRKNPPVGRHSYGSVAQSLLLLTDVPIVITGRNVPPVDDSES